MIKLDDYETANDSNIRFRAAYPDGRVVNITQIIDLEKGYCLIRSELYKNQDDIHPSAVNMAHGNVSFYPPHMRRWFIEDTITSSEARVIKSFMPVKNKPSREDMEQVVNAPVSADLWATPLEPVGTAEPFSTGVEAARQALGGVMPPEPPYCNHGHMLWKEGKSDKTGNAYKGWVCPSKTKPQCPARWEQVNG